MISIYVISRGGLTNATDLTSRGGLINASVLTLCFGLKSRGLVSQTTWYLLAHLHRQIAVALPLDRCI